MQAVLALAFLALARAAIIEVPKTIINGEIFPKENMINPLWTTRMFEKFGLVKPMFDDMSAWGKSIGVEEPWMLNDMRSLYEKPSLVFFQDPAGRIISFYAHEGIDKTSFFPEVKDVFTGLYDSSDKLAIDFHPEHMLGNHKHVLPGHFFEPLKTVELNHFLNEMPSTFDHVIFKPNTMMKKFWNKFDIDTLPMIHKEPVTLDINKKFLSDAIMPLTHVAPINRFSDFGAVPFGKSGIVSGASPLTPFTTFSDFGAVPFGKSGIVSGASHLTPFTTFSDFGAAPFGKSGIVSGASHMMPFTTFSDFSNAVPFGKSGIVSGASHMMPFTGFRSALGAGPAVKSPAYHLVKADMPFFTAAPAAGFVDSAAIPLVKSGLFGDNPVHATHFINPHAAGAASLVKAVPCVGCLGSEHSFAPAGAIPLVKTFSDSGFTGFGASDTFKSFPGMFAEPATTFGATPVTFGAAPMTLGASPILKAAPATSSLFVDPAVGLTGYTSGFGASPITGWGKFF